MAMIHENRAAANMPAMASSSYTSQTYAGGQLAGINALVGAAGGGGGFGGIAQGGIAGGVGGGGGQFGGVTDDWNKQMVHEAAHRAVLRLQHRGEAAEEAGAMANQSKRRLVQVLIVDPNENIPLDKCLLYRGEQKLTDATDTELYFELDIKDILAKHNEERIKLVDKKVKERTEYLEPAKIRDLKMVVVTVAEF